MTAQGSVGSDACAAVAAHVTRSDADPCRTNTSIDGREFVSPPTSSLSFQPKRSVHQCAAIAWPTLLNMTTTKPASSAWLHGARLCIGCACRTGTATVKTGAGRGATASRASSALTTRALTTRNGGQRVSRLTRALRTSASLPPTTRNCRRFSPVMPRSTPVIKLIC